MKVVSIRSVTRHRLFCKTCEIADTPWTRVKGLLGRNFLNEGEGLLIVPCSSIHTIGMQFALDVVFLTRDYIVTDFVENIAPGKYYVSQKYHGKAHAALEMAGGAISEFGLQRGEQLEAF